MKVKLLNDGFYKACTTIKFPVVVDAEYLSTSRKKIVKVSADELIKAGANFSKFKLENIEARFWVATRLEGLGISREIVAKCLSHAGDDAATTGRYARSAHWEARQNALNALGNALESCDKGLNPSAYAGDNVGFLDKRAG